MASTTDNLFDFINNFNANNNEYLNQNVVGLANVNNTSDADKPISIATQSALNLKQDNTNKINVIPLASLFTSNVIARANVTDWSFPVTAGKVYSIEINANYQTAALTTGGSMGFILPTGAGTIQGFIETEIVQTTGATGVKTTIRAINATNTTAGSFMTSTGVGVINSPHNWYAKLSFVCTTSGTFQVQWASEIAGSAAQINANSTLIYQQIN